MLPRVVGFVSSRGKNGRKFSGSFSRALCNTVDGVSNADVLNVIGTSIDIFVYIHMQAYIFFLVRFMIRDLALRNILGLLCPCLFAFKTSPPEPLPYITQNATGTVHVGYG